MEIYKGALHFQRPCTIKKVEVVLCVPKLFLPRGILHYIQFILRLIPDIYRNYDLHVENHVCFRFCNSGPAKKPVLLMFYREVWYGIVVCVCVFSQLTRPLPPCAAHPSVPASLHRWRCDVLVLRWRAASPPLVEAAAVRLPGVKGR